MSERLHHIESASSPETFRPIVDVITISGHPGTGKTVVGEALAKRYGMEYVKIGQKFREHIREQQGEEIIGYMERPEDVDLELDETQRMLIRNAGNEGRKIILEGRLAHIIATEELQRSIIEDKPRPEVVRILFTADPDVRIQRVHKRNSEFELDEIRKMTKEREEGDLTTWRKFHPIIPKDRDIYDPEIINAYGVHPFFDLVFDTTTTSVDQSTEIIHQRLLENNYVTDNLTSKHAAELIVASDIFSQGSPNFQKLIFTYLNKTKPFWNIPDEDRVEILDNLSNSYPEEIDSSKQENTSGVENRRPSIREVELKKKILEFQEILNSDNTSNETVIENLALGLIELDGIFIVESDGSGKSRLGVKEEDRYLSYLCHFAMNDYPTGYRELDRMFDDIRQFAKEGGFNNLNRESDALLSAIIKVYNTMHWAGQKNPVFTVQE